MAHAGERTHGLLTKSSTRVFTGNGMHDSFGVVNHISIKKKTKKLERRRFNAFKFTKLWSYEEVAQ